MFLNYLKTLLISDSTENSESAQEPLLLIIKSIHI